jgi:predicted phage baseplate assembly protein
VNATYRNGIGSGANVAAGQITLLNTRPLGVTAVVNPLPATGGANRDSRDQARRNVPLAVTALDRLVSVQDYADFARTFAGIGKASATRLSDGHRQLVHLTVAGANDIPIAEGSDLYKNLYQALLKLGDPFEPLQLVTRELIVLVISARVQVLPDYQWTSVAPRIRSTLLDTLGFDRRDLGQSVYLSEVISTIQQVQGVSYVDVNTLEGISETEVSDTDRLKAKLAEIADATQPKSTILVRLAIVDPKQKILLPAQLAFLTPNIADALILTEIPQ